MDNEPATMTDMDKDKLTDAEIAYAKEVGRLLTEAKDTAGLTFDDLAQMTGLSRPHITRVFYGTIDVRIADLKRIGRVLEVDPFKILDLAEKNTK